MPVQNLNRLPVPAKRMVLIQNFLRTTEHVSDLLGRLWFMRPSFEKFAGASRLLALPYHGRYSTWLVGRVYLRVIEGMMKLRRFSCGEEIIQSIGFEKPKLSSHKYPDRSNWILVDSPPR